MLLSEWVGAKDGANHMKVHKQRPPEKNYLIPNVNSAEVELPWSRESPGRATTGTGPGAV